MRKIGWITAAPFAFAAWSTGLMADALPCPALVQGPGVAEDAIPDRIHAPLVSPGGFGGQVMCMQRQAGETVEQHFAEVLASDDTGRRADVVYLDTKTVVSLSPLPARGLPRTPLSECAPTQAGGVACLTDLGQGAGIFLRRGFAPDGTLQGALLYLAEGSVFLPPVLTQTAEEIEVRLELPEAGAEIILERQELQGQVLHVIREARALTLLLEALLPQPAEMHFVATIGAVQGEERRLKLSKDDLNKVLGLAMQLEVFSFQRRLP